MDGFSLNEMMYVLTRHTQVLLFNNLVNFTGILILQRKAFRSLFLYFDVFIYFFLEQYEGKND